MNGIGSNLELMGVEHYLFAFLFLMSYSGALARWVGLRARACAAVLALAAVAGFAGASDPWERGVLVMALPSSWWGGLSALVWAVMALIEQRHTGTHAGARTRSRAGA